MKKTYWILNIGVVIFTLLIGGCRISKEEKKLSIDMPKYYPNTNDTINSSEINWQAFFNDTALSSLIDKALKNNQELNIFLQEIEISKNEVKARKGEYLPFMGLSGGSGFEKEGKYTRNGSVDDQLNIMDNHKFPVPLSDFRMNAYTSWEIDIWKKLRNSKKSAMLKYMAGIEGKNFLVTNLIAEIAQSYYELIALDNTLTILEMYVDIQSAALKVVKQQKESAKVSQLAVNRFEAQLLNTQNLQFSIKQKIIETENRINFLTGSYPQTIKRNSANFLTLTFDSIKVGTPYQLIENRPDIRKSELEIQAALMDIKSARANFYPSLGIRGGAGLQAFKATLLLSPESILYNLAGDLIAPLINRNAIKALYNSSKAKHSQTLYNYQRSVMNAYIEVNNQINKIKNYSNSFNTKQKEVDILTQSINISNGLFNYAKADYGEVLFTQREALESKMELVEIRLKQLEARILLYRALGGGWR